MADLFAILSQAGSGLGAHSAALATAGHNIANANTPGYARQIVNLVANPPPIGSGSVGVGRGVSVESITQARDQFIERQMPNALGAEAHSQAESASLQAVSALDPDMAGGLTDAMGAFYGALRNLSQNPSDLGMRQGVIGSSQALARSFNQTVSSVEDARLGIDGQIEGDLIEINNAARSLADLNKQIQSTRGAGAPPNDLMDKRQIAIDTLAALTGATPYSNATGDISMALPGGAALVTDGGAGSLSAAADPANSGHIMLRLTRADGSGPVDLGAGAVGGEVGGLFAARDGALKTAITSLDSFAFDFANATNAIHQAGFAMDSSTGRPLFTIPATAAGAATKIAINPALVADARLLAAATTAPAASGDNRNLLALIDSENQALAGGGSPGASFQTIVTNFGNSSAQAQAFADHDQAMAGHLRQLRESTSGVSLDEEMINLTKAQRAYEALARVIATSNSMLDTLMSLK